MKQRTMLDKEAFEKFVRPDTGEIIEVRGLKIFGPNPGVYEGYAKGTVAGYFDNHEALVKAVKPAMQLPGAQLYMTLQVINPELIGRACNRLKPAANTTGDQDVIAYRWLFVDLDPVRPSGVSSSDEELAAAMEMREEIAEFCTREYGFASPVKAMSGNGAHLLFPLADLPAQDDKVQKFIKQTLVGLDRKFTNKKVEIDATVCNPGRITKLYGAKACKGDPVPGGARRTRRPHRLSYIDSLGE